MYRSLNSELKREFGCKVYKLALSGGMTCPNRDGKIGTRGCIFCAENGSGYFAQPVCGSIAEKIKIQKRGKKYAQNYEIAHCLYSNHGDNHQHKYWYIYEYLFKFPI